MITLTWHLHKDTVKLSKFPSLHMLVDCACQCFHVLQRYPVASWINHLLLVSQLYSMWKSIIPSQSYWTFCISRGVGEGGSHFYQALWRAQWDKFTLGFQYLGTSQTGSLDSGIQGDVEWQLQGNCSTINWCQDLIRVKSHLRAAIQHHFGCQCLR